jgi:RNA polymerase sigma-70 factor (ECF subfamily)
MRAESLSTSSAKAINRQALADIYERYNSDIFRYACRLLNDRDLAEDCVADTFHRFLVAVRGGTSIENSRAYLYRTAHNWITDHYRRRPPPDVSWEEEIHVDTNGNPSQVIAQEMDRRRIHAALLRLSPEQRQVIELRYLENLSHFEVAAVLGKTVEATRALQYRATEALRQLLVDEHELPSNE